MRFSCTWRWHQAFFFFKQKTAYEIRKGDWSSDVCSFDLFYDARWAEGAPDLLLHYFGLVVNENVVFWLALGHFGGYHPVEFWVFVVASCGRVRDPVESHENRRMQANRFTPVEPLTCFACEYVGFPLVYPSTGHVQSHLEYVGCLHARVEDRRCIRIL